MAEGDTDDEDFYDAEDGFTKAIAIVGHAAGAVGVNVPAQPLPAVAKHPVPLCVQKVLAEKDEELSLSEGDLVQIEFKSENGWWVGTNLNSGSSGIFPAGSVEEIDWSDDPELELADYQAELAKMADELHDFEADGGEAGGEIFLYNVLAEIKLTATLALKAGFCNQQGLDTTEVFTFMASEVLVAIALRSIDTPEGISLLGAIVAPGMVPPGTAGSLCGLIRDIAAALDKLPVDSRETDELLQSAFARHVPTSEVAARIGEQHVQPFTDARQAVGAAAKLLADDAHFMAQYKESVAGSPEAKAESTNQTWKDKLKAKVSIAKGKGSSLITTLSAKAKQLAIKTGAKAKTGKEKAKPVMASAVTKTYAASLLATMKLKTFAQAQRQKRSNRALVKKAKAMPKKTAPPRPPPPTQK